MAIGTSAEIGFHYYVLTKSPLALHNILTDECMASIRARGSYLLLQQTVLIADRNIMAINVFLHTAPRLLSDRAECPGPSENKKNHPLFFLV